ncbi:tRNA pseudouridine synthase A [Planobispora longispora]|uniref:tRNA pseudouridine synthase A n=1 Tax=Planobispora longispora TaxID=28887 RepID=UPI00194269BF|nr:tRNA pseudouridine synthase A [Planobispora longispora]
MVRLRLDLAYDGTGFSGWARQPGRRTVQGEIEEALAKALRLTEPPSLTVAGRTDAGVHARGQVAHLDVEPDALLVLENRRRRGSSPAHGPAGGESPDEGRSAGAGPLGGERLPGWEGESGVAERLDILRRRLAGILDPDVRIYRVTVAPEGFDARFSAMSRRYAYRVCDAPGGVDPLRRREVVWYTRPLDLDRLNAAAAHLIGEHDFAAFCKKREGATTIRELQRLDWVHEDGLLVATVVADAFCHSMVRALVGSLLAVGEGRLPVDWPGQVLAGAVRDSRVHVAPAHGLCLEEVSYPEAAELARRAAATRRVRTLGE